MGGPILECTIQAVILKKNNHHQSMQLINELIFYFMAAWEQRKQAALTVTFKVDITNLLAFSSLFTHPADTEPRYTTSCGVVLFAKSLLSTNSRRKYLAL